MKLTVLSVLLTSVAVMSGCASTGSSATSASAIKEVEALERARFKVLVAVDLPALKPMLADDLLYCHSSGICQNKEEFLGFLTENKYLAMDIVHMKPRQFGDAVMINGKLNVRVETAGKVQTIPLVYTDVYAKGNGRWQLVSWQSTRVP